MVMVLAAFQFKHRVSAFKMMPLDQSGGFKLGQHPVNGCQADFHTLLQQGFVDILGGQMPLGIRAVLQHF